MIALSSYSFLQKIANLPFVYKLWVFGSRARGDHREKSDIDLALSCPQATPQQWQQVLDIINDADTLLPIECIRYDQLKNDDKLKQAIDRDKVLLYEKTNRQSLEDES